MLIEGMIITAPIRIPNSLLLSFWLCVSAVLSFVQVVDQTLVPSYQSIGLKNLDR